MLVIATILALIVGAAVFGVVLAGGAVLSIFGWVLGTVFTVIFSLWFWIPVGILLLIGVLLTL